MTIALDATYSAGLNLSGVGVYSRKILFGLAAAHPEQAFAWCYRAHRLREAFRQPRSPNVRMRLLAEQLNLFSCDLFHGLNQRLPARRFRRAVCTFHDLFVLTSEYSTREFRERFAEQARGAAERADLIVCVSEFTARQVEHLLGVERGRLRVIPHGTRFPEDPGRARREPVILHVGAVQRRKNLTRLVAAFERAAPAPWRLVLAGSHGYGAEETLERIARSPARERIELTGWVDDETLAALYGQASLFAFPSLDEGFGIPVLEAMANGVPVLASNRSAVPEACGGAALLADPLSEDALAEALRALIGDAALRERLAGEGLRRAREFTWEKAVERTWQVYGELAG